MSLFALQRKGAEPIYLQIAKRLKEEISDSFCTGDLVPSETELALRFGVNRHTVRRAVEELVAAGILERQQGRGTFVLDVPVDYEVNCSTRFTETVKSMGKQADDKILRKMDIPASGGVAKRLTVAQKKPVIWIESLRLADRRPLCIISHFLPRQRFPHLLDEYQGGSLHEHLESVHSLKLRRRESLVTAVLPQGDDASLLGMPQNSPILRVKSINVDDRDGTPLEYSLTRFRADRIQLRIRP